MNMQIGEKIWQNAARSIMPQYIRIIGRVIGKVFIKDIGYNVMYNTVIDIPAQEAVGSNDLQNAIQKKWVDVVYGKELLNTDQQYNTDRQLKLSANNQNMRAQVIQQNIDINDLKNYVANETQKAIDAMSSSMTVVVDELKKLKQNNASDVNLNDDAINKLVSLIKDNIPKSQKEEKSDNASHIFINVNDDKELKSNIEVGKLGQVTKKKDKKAKSVVSKLKNMNIKQGDENGDETT